MNPSAILDAAQIAYARLNSLAGLRRSSATYGAPSLAHRRSPAGPLRALLPPVTISGVEPNMGAIPALGEHTAAILKDLGFDAAQIAAWKQAGVI